MIKRLFLILGAILLVLLAWIVFVVVTFDAEELGQKVIQLINNKTDWQLSAERFAFHPLEGLELEQVLVAAKESPESLSASLEGIVVEYDLLPLLQRQLVISRIVLAKPVIETKSPAAPSTEPASAEAKAGLGVSIGEIKIVDGNLVQRVEGSSEELHLTGLGIELGDLKFDPNARTTVAALGGSGNFRVDSVVSGELTLTDIAGQLALDDGNLLLSMFSLRTANGDLEAEKLSANLAERPAPFELVLGGSLDLGGAMGLAAEEPGFGPVSMSLQAGGLGPQVDHLVGQGVLRIESGELPAVPAIVQIEKILKTSIVTGAAYETCEVGFRLENGVLRVDPFELRGDLLSVSGSGSAHLDGAVNFPVLVSIPRSEVDPEGMSSDDLERLSDSEGVVRLPFIVEGTLGEPEVGLDWDVIKQGVVQEAKDRAEEAVQEAAGNTKDKPRSKVSRDDG